MLAVRDQLISSVRANLGAPPTGPLQKAVRDEFMRLYTKVGRHHGQALKQQASREVVVSDRDAVQKYVREISQRKGGLEILAAIFKFCYIKSQAEQRTCGERNQRRK